MEGEERIASEAATADSKTQTYKIRYRIKRLVTLVVNLFGKKTKKSFFSVISHLLEEYRQEGLINVEEEKMFRNIASFGDKRVASIMTPRSDIVAVERSSGLEEMKKIIVDNGYTRVPVYKDNIDEIIGFIHSKDLVKFLCKEGDDFSVDKIMRKILFVTGSMKLVDVMLRMRVTRVHVAIVLDEFGGVDGFITIENIVEEIVGDIEDEHDIPSDNSFFKVKKISEDTFNFGGRVEIEKVEQMLGIKLKKNYDEFETIAGFIMVVYKGIPEIGEEIIRNNLKLKVIDSDNKSIKMVEVKILQEDE